MPPLDRDGPGRYIRQVVNAIFYVVRTGYDWKNLPQDYPNHNSRYYYYRKQCKDRIWRRVNTALRKLDCQQHSRNEGPSADMIDTKSVKAAEADG